MSNFGAEAEHSKAEHSKAEHCDLILKTFPVRCS